MKKRAMSIVLALCLAASLLPCAAFAEDAEEVQETASEEPFTEEEAPAENSAEETAGVDAPEADAGIQLLAEPVSYGVDGGNLYFDPSSGSITGCDESVTVATIPSEINGVRVTGIGRSAFFNCQSLTGVSIPGSITSIGNGAFSWCTGLTGITLPPSVTSIGDEAFRYCTGLGGIIIPSSVDSIGRSAFAACKGLIRVTIPGSVASIEYGAFEGCTGLTGITISRGTTSIGSHAFSGCSSLTGVTIPGSVTSIGDYAFSGCKSLTSVMIPSSVTSIGSDSFADCDSLASVVIPRGTTRIGDSAFWNCSSLTDVSIPDGVTSIEDGVFSNCTSLKRVTLPGSVNRIGISTFSNCVSLTDVTIPNGVAGIGANTFWNCNSLTSITIPDSVSIIRLSAFGGCDKLTDVFYTGSESDWSRIEIQGTNDPLLKAAVHCYSKPAGPSSPEPFYPGTLTVSENRKGPGTPQDDYRLSAGAAVSRNGQADQSTGKDGAYQIDNTASLTGLTVSKEGFAPAVRTAEQLREHREIYLEPTQAGYPTVSAVWLDNVDIRHFEYGVDLLRTAPVTIKADVVWDSGKGPGTIQLVQGSKSAAFDGNTLTTVLKDRFDVHKTIYIQAGYDSTYKTMKPLKLKAASAVPGALNGFKCDFGDKLEFPLPDDIPFLGGKKMGVGVNSNIPVTLEVEDGKIYAVIGFEKDDVESDDSTDQSAKFLSKSVKDLRDKLKKAGGDATSAVNQYKKMQDAMKAFGGRLIRGKGSFGIDTDYSVIGFAEGYLDGSGIPRWLDSGMIVSISGSADYSFPFSIGPVPLFFETTLSAEATGQLNLLVREAAKSFTPDGVIEGSISLSGGLGAGIKNVAVLSGGLEGELSDHWEIDPDDADYNRLTAKLKAYAKAGILCYSEEKSWDFAEKTLEWPSRASLQSLEEEAYTALYDALYDPDSYTLASEAELTDRSVFLAGGTASLFSAEDGGTQETPFAADVYSQARPQLASFSDGTLLAVWTGLDNSREIYDRPRLYYALCEDGIWSSPAPVDVNGTAMEGEPSLTVTGDTACLAWCRANGPMGTPADLTEAAAKLDIFAGVLNRTDGQWTVSRLTDNQTADFSPIVSGESGGAAIVWQSSSANDLFCKTGSTSVSACRYTDGTWSQASKLYDHVGEISGLAADLSGGELRTAWTLAEEDGFSVYLDGVRQGSGSGAVFSNGSLYWYQDGQLCQDGQNTGAALASDRFQVENNTLLYASGSGLYSTLTARCYDPASGRWSDAVALTDGKRFIGSFSAASVGASLRVLMSSTAVNKALAEIQSDSDDPYGSTDLVLLSDTPFCDLSLDGPWYLEAAYTPGSTMSFHLEVTNRGTVPTNYAVSVSGPDGETGNTVISRQRLLPGCTEEVTVSCEQSETPRSQLTFTVKALDSSDAVSTNDQVFLTLQYEDVAVEHAGSGMTEDGQYLVCADIVNRGYGAQSGITVSLYRDAVSGTPLQTAEVASLDPLSSRPVSFPIPTPVDESCYVIAVSHSGTDMNAATDSDFILCRPQAGTAVELISVEGSQVELWLDGGIPAGTLVVAAYDGSGRMDTIGMTSLSGSETEVRVTMRTPVPDGDSLKAYILDAGTKAPLLKPVHFRSQAFSS